MAIARTYNRRSAVITEDGQEVATVYALNADAMKDVLLLVGNQITGMLDVLEELKVVASDGDAALADAILADLPRLITTVVGSVPNLLSAIIATAAEDPDGMEIIKTWSFPLQWDAASKAVRLTFPDDQALRSMVGNVLALVRTASALTSTSAEQTSDPQKSSTQVGPQSLVDG